MVGNVKKLFIKALGCDKNSTKYQTYHNYRVTLTRLKKHVKKEHYKNLFTKIGKNSRNLWSVLNGLMKKLNNKHEISTLIEDGKICDNRKFLPNVINNHFTDVGKRTQEKIPTNNYDYKQFIKYKVKSNLLLSPTSGEEITKIIMKMKDKLSSGHDGITNKFLKQIVHSVKFPLEIIYNKSLNEGIFPDLLKLAKVKPLYKSDDPSICDNYRPISLLPVFSKVIEKIVYCRLCSHMEDNDILYSKQFGFRKRHGTSDAITNFVSNLYDALEKDFMICSVFIDLKKAFDTVSHSIVLEKLKSIGVQDVALMWFQSYLMNRQQFTELNDINSDCTEISTGVPQGSLLGVILFQLEINDMRNALVHCDSILYADDTTIYVIGRNLRFMRKKLQSDLDNLSMWLKANKLLLNVKKTKMMVWSRKPIIGNFSLTVNGECIEEVNEFKFLGCWLDNKLDWEKHVFELCNKLQKCIYIIGKLRQYVPKECLKLVYFANFHSHLMYVNHVWGNGLKSKLLDRIEKLQKRVVRCICNKSILEHSNPCFKSLKIVKFRDQLDINTTKLMFQVSNKLSPLPIQNLFSISTRHNRAVTFVNKIHKSSQYNKCFMNQCVTKWNSLLCSQRNCKNSKIFTRNMKRRYIEKY